MTAYTGDLLKKALHLTGSTGITVGSDTIATPATGDTITISNFWPELPTTRLGLILVFSSPLDTNASPGTFTAGDGTDADGYLVATSMGNIVAATGTAALFGAVASSRDLVITLGTIATAGSGVIVTAFGLYEGGDTVN